MTTYKLDTIVLGLVIESIPARLPIDHPDYFAQRPSTRCTLNGEVIAAERAQALLDKALEPDRRIVVG